MVLNRFVIFDVRLIYSEEMVVNLPEADMLSAFPQSEETINKN